MNRDSAKVPYLHKAYKLAVRTRNYKEMVFIADSLAQIYVYQPDIHRATKWLARLKLHLGKYRDKPCEQTYRELEKELKVLRSN